MRRPFSFFGIQLKLFAVLVLFAAVLFLTASYGLYGAYAVTLASQKITETEIPLTKVVNEALVAMLEGKLALEEALAVDYFSQKEEIREHEFHLSDSILVFDAHLAAITWGSESEAFRKSGGGLNVSEWQRLHPADDSLVIQRPAAEQVQLAGVADIYFGGFSRNASEAIAAHKKFLRLKSEGREAEMEEAREVRREHVAKALRFSRLVTATLAETVQISNTAIAESAKAIQRTQQDVIRNMLFIFLIGSLAFLLVSFAFVRRTIVNPVQALTSVARALGSGNLSARAKIKSKDEIGVLANVFNQMADRLAEYPSQLEREVREKTNKLNELNKSLQIWLQENDEIGKILVRRDLELTQSNERLRDLDEAKSQFVSVAAHQLRTPLAGIKWTLYALLEAKVGRLNEEQEKFAGDAYKATIRLIDLVNDLLDVARLEEGRFGFKIKKQSLVPLVKKAYENFQKAAKGKGIKFSLELPKEDIPFLDFDEDKIAIVLENLVDNAIKYTPPGGKVALVIRKEKNRVSVEVADTGIGMPASQIGRVFTKFFRAENAQLYQTSGTGLGLYLAQNIVEHHGGAMFFKTEENKGSTFTFSLPISKSDIKKV